MKTVPGWFKILAVAVAALMVVVLLGAALSVALRWLQPHTGADQPRVHYQTKNTTRLTGDNLTEVGALVARAVYPDTTPANAPDVLLVYDDDNWQGGLQLAPLTRALNGLLIPSSVAAALPDDFTVDGSDQLDGAQSLLLAEDLASAPSGLDATTIQPEEVVTLLEAAGEPPRHAIIVDRADPATAILAAPWAARTGDLIVYDAASAPDYTALYALGDAAAPDGVPRIGNSNPAATAVAFAKYEDLLNPLFGWGMNADALTGYRGFIIAPEGEPGIGLLAANLARRGKSGPLFWTGADELPQGLYNYFFSQRAAFWNTPSEGPFHHFYILGNTDMISFPVQSSADYSVEIGPYLQKGIGAGPMDMLAAVWVFFGVVSAIWIAIHEAKFLPYQNWLMKLAWPLLALMVGPFGIPLYRLAYNRPIIRRGEMIMYDRPLWLQGMVATASAVGFGAMIMITTGYLLTLFGLPLFPLSGWYFLLGTPMILVMIINYVVAVIVAWLLFQTPMMAVMYGTSYRDALSKAFPLVATSMLAAAVGMNPSMWWFMMWKIPMMPSEESILWFGVMFVTGFLAFLIAWPLNYYFVRTQRKAGLM